MKRNKNDTDAVCPAHCNIPYEKCVQESEQLAEWLEELKELRNMTAEQLKEGGEYAEQFKD